MYKKNETSLIFANVRIGTDLKSEIPRVFLFHRETKYEKKIKITIKIKSKQQ